MEAIHGRVHTPFVKLKTMALSQYRKVLLLKQSTSDSLNPTRNKNNVYPLNMGESAVRQLYTLYSYIAIVLAAWIFKYEIEFEYLNVNVRRYSNVYLHSCSDTHDNVRSCKRINGHISWYTLIWTTHTYEASVWWIPPSYGLERYIHDSNSMDSLCHRELWHGCHHR